jgi:hypothetical protein
MSDSAMLVTEPPTIPIPMCPDPAAIPAMPAIEDIAGAAGIAGVVGSVGPAGIADPA